MEKSPDVAHTTAVFSTAMEKHLNRLQMLWLKGVINFFQRCSMENLQEKCPVEKM